MTDDFSETQPSICIPRVFENITETRIRRTFNQLNIGEISRIDIKERKNERGERFKRVYIHFNKWYWNEYAQMTRAKLINGKEIKIVYDNPWFWKVSASKWVDKSCKIAPALSNIAPSLRELKEELEEEREEFEKLREEKLREEKRQQREEEERQKAEEERREAEERLIVPRNSPVDEDFEIDYGNVTIPKKRNWITNKKSIEKEKEIDELYDDVI
jgi:hypothetical protein